MGTCTIKKVGVKQNSNQEGEDHNDNWEKHLFRTKKEGEDGYKPK
jgi:hypothetical protein